MIRLARVLCCLGVPAAARRAVLRCGARGFPLPPDTHADWRSLALNFDPAGALLR